ncbi:MAG: hypothetical protein KGI89_15490, partial [Euryarchaeota archaeon]|nr:hypothetical protein [Euryarchaeota archaeon]
MSLEVKAIGGRFYLYEVQYSWDRKKGRSRKRTVRYLGPCDPAGKLLRRPRIATEALRAVEPVGAPAALYAQAVDLDVVRVAEETLGLSRRTAAFLLALAIDAATGPRAPGVLESWVARGPLSWWEPSLRGASLGPLMTELREKLHPGTHADGPSPRAAFEAELTRAWTSRALVPEPPGAFVEARAPEGPGVDGSESSPPAYGVVLSRASLLPMSILPVEAGLAGRDLPALMGALRGALPRGTPLVEVLPIPTEGSLSEVVQAGLHVVGSLGGASKEVWKFTGRQAAVLAQGPPLSIVGPRGGLLAYDLEESVMGHRLRLGVLEDPGWRERERWERASLLAEWSAPIPDALRPALARELEGALASARGRRGARMDPEKIREVQERDGRWVVFSTDLRVDVPSMIQLLERRRILQRILRGPSVAVEPWKLRYGAVTLWELGATIGFLASL